MATDLKKVWFDSIAEGNVQSVSRLVYATPNPKAGEERIQWKTDFSAELSTDISSKLDLDDTKEFWALPYAVICFVKSGKSKPCLDIIKIILSSTGSEMINSDIGNGNTVLHLVSAIGDMEITRMILAKQPDSSLANKQGKLALNVCAPLVKNMISNYHTDFTKKKAISSNRSSPEKFMLTVKTSAAPSSTIRAMSETSLTVKAPVNVSASEVNKIDVAESLLKELGIDENDREAQQLKKQILKRSASKERSPTIPTPLIAKTVNIQNPKTGISVSLGSTSIQNSSATPKALPPVFNEHRGRVKEVKIPEKQLASFRRNISDIFDDQKQQQVPVNKANPSMSAVEKIETSKKDQGATEMKELKEPIKSVKISTENISKKEERQKSAVNVKDYQATIKTPVILVDEISQNDRSVNFKNSWKGELERTRKFFADSSTVMMSQHIGRPSVSASTFTAQPADESNVVQSTGRFLLRIKSLRDLVLNYSRVPDAAYAYCFITGSGVQPVKTAAVPFGMENMYTNIPLSTELAFDLNDETELTLKVDLLVRLEFEQKVKQGLFRAESVKNFFRSSTPSKSRSGEKIVFDQKIGYLTIPISKLLKESRQDNRQTWELMYPFFDVPLTDSNSIQRSDSRASFTYLKSKIFKGQKGAADIVKCEVAECGSLSYETFYIPEITQEDLDRGNLPIHIDDALEWTERKKWQDTLWFEGFMSQQGGDVKCWRRRFYKLQGSKLLAHHEFTREYRASIDLSQVVKLDELPVEIDGESYPTPFSFRLHFKHGEQIDFYAESKTQYEEWIGVLNKVLAEMPEALINTPSIMQKSKNASFASSKRRSPKNQSLSGLWTSTVSGNDNDMNFKSYDKRYKTPAVKKGISLMKPPQFDEFDHEQESTLASSSSNNSSFVGIFGTQKGNMTIPEL